MADLRKAKVLIIDDEADSIMVLHQFLRDKYHVLYACTGDEGLDVARESLPELILLDVRMPGMDGFEVCRRLKQAPETLEIPVIFVTGTNQYEDQEKGFLTGAVDYLTKPVQAAVVRARVGNQINLQRAERMLQRNRRLESLGNLTAGITHEFNNTLAIILGNLEFLETLVENDPRALRRVHTSTNAAQRMAKRLQQLLGFSPSHRGHGERLDPTPLIDELSPRLKEIIGDRVKLRIRHTHAPWPVHAERAELEETLLQLAENAHAAMPDGGELFIESENQVIDELFSPQGPLANPGEYLQIAVSDTGTGMTQEVTEHLFEPFFTTQPFGTSEGLGMSRVYGFVQRSGGAIRVYSEVGMGTTIRIYLPRHDDAQDQAEPCKPEHGKKIPNA